MKTPNEKHFREWLKKNYGIQDSNNYEGTQTEEIAIQYASQFIPESRPRDEDEFYRYLLHEIVDYEQLRSGYKSGNKFYEIYDALIAQLEKVKLEYVLLSKKKHAPLSQGDKQTKI